MTTVTLCGLQYCCARPNIMPNAAMLERSGPQALHEHVRHLCVCLLGPAGGHYTGFIGMFNWLAWCLVLFVF
jgi:hypothetical protein